MRDEAQVIREELPHIARRREVQFGRTGEADRSVDEKEVRRSMVGLALSGGGIRSGAFSLGMIQALDRIGVLRFIDYLSTVSGGGYAGAHLSSDSLADVTTQELQDVESRLKSDPKSRPGELSRRNGLSISQHASGKQSDRMQSFLYGGKYLAKTGLFLHLYLIGLVLIFTVTFSGLVMLTSGLSWLFHNIDYPAVRDTLYLLGFDGDVAQAYFPALVFLALWIALSTFAALFRIRSRPGSRRAKFWRQCRKVAKGTLLYLLIPSILLATASLIGTGDLAPASNNGSAGQGNPVQSVAYTIGFVLLAVGLLPYLRPERLLRSGTTPKSSVEKLVFWIATRAALFGVPLATISYFSRENISGWNDGRDGGLRTSSEFVGWGDAATCPFWIQTKLDVSPRDWTALGLDPRFRALDVEQAKFARLIISENGPGLNDPQSSSQGVPGIAYAAFTAGEVERRWWEMAKCIGQWLGSGYRWPEEGQNRFADARQVSAELRADKNEIAQRFTREFMATHDFHANSFIRWKKAEPQPKRLEGDALLLDDREALAQRRRIERNRAEMERDRIYKDLIVPRSTIFSSVVIHKDQETRLNWFLFSGAVFLLSTLFVNLNHTSWHAFYASRLAEMWIEKVDRSRRRIPLSQLQTVSVGRPFHLLNATLNVLAQSKEESPHDTLDRFLWSPLYCGSERLGFARTADFHGGRYTLVDAMAISGAAVTPVMRFNPLVSVLLFVLNIRLGQWVENPGLSRQSATRWRRFRNWWPFTPMRFLWNVGFSRLLVPVSTPVRSGEAATEPTKPATEGESADGPDESAHAPKRGDGAHWTQKLLPNAESQTHCFLTDGGHFENLGLEPLLMRRCRLIVVADAGHDGSYEFADLMRVIRWMKIRHGILVTALWSEDVSLDLNELVPCPKSNNSREHFIVARIRYPDADLHDGFLIYAKSTMTADCPSDLRLYRQRHPEFPHDSTANQFYDPGRFESYRSLGELVARSVCKGLPADWKDRKHQGTFEEFEELIYAMAGLPNPSSKVGGAVRTLLDTSTPSSLNEKCEAASTLGEHRERSSINVLIAVVLTNYAREPHRKLAIVAYRSLQLLGPFALRRLKERAGDSYAEVVFHCTESDPAERPSSRNAAAQRKSARDSSQHESTESVAVGFATPAPDELESRSTDPGEPPTSPTTSAI